MSESERLSDYRPLDPGTLSCPHAWWSMLRREAPVIQIQFPDVDVPVFLVTRKKEIMYACDHPEIFSQHPPPSVWRWGNFEPDIDREFSKCGYKVVQTLATADPPDAQRYRAVIDERLNRRRVPEYEPMIRDIIADLVKALPENEPFNFVRSFSIPLPLEVICLILGLPYSDADFLERYTDEFVRLIDPSHSKQEAIEAARNVADGYSYLASRILDAREAPHDGMLSAYANARMPDGSRFPLEESISMASQTVIAGNETTRNAISSTALQLMTRKDLWQRLKDNRKLISQFVEESLRLNAPATATGRSVLMDTELNGVAIPKGSAVFLVWGSGSHDESVFEDPEDFDLDRRNKRGHTTFGFGLHHCSGNFLARAELNLSVEHWLDEFETMKLAVPVDQVQYLPVWGFRALGDLPVIIERRKKA